MKTSISSIGIAQQNFSIARQNERSDGSRAIFKPNIDRSDKIHLDQCIIGQRNKLLFDKRQIELGLDSFVYAKVVGTAINEGIDPNFFKNYFRLKPFAGVKTYLRH